MSGFLKIYRTFFFHNFWKEERAFSRAEAFLDLLQLAAHAHTKKLIKGVLIKLEPGQLCGSERYLAGRWGWSTKKVRLYIALLEGESMVVTERKQSGSILTLLNYEKYASAFNAEEAQKKHQGSTEEAPRKQIKEREEYTLPPTPPLCTLIQAKSQASAYRYSEEEAEHWWNTRNRSGWSIAPQSGGAAKRITSWQSDMAVSLPWVKESMAKAARANQNKTFNSTNVGI